MKNAGELQNSKMYLCKLVFSKRKLVHQRFGELHRTQVSFKDLLNNITRTLQMTPRESPNRLVQHRLKGKDTVCLQSCFLGYLKGSVLKTGKFLSSSTSPILFSSRSEGTSRQDSSIARSRTPHRALTFHAQESAVAHYSHRHAIIKTGLRTIRK